MKLSKIPETILIFVATFMVLWVIAPLVLWGTREIIAKLEKEQEIREKTRGMYG